MGLTNDSLIDTVFEKFPEKKNVKEQGDDIFVNWNFQDFQDGGYLNFKADRSDLFALSIRLKTMHRNIQPHYLHHLRQTKDMNLLKTDISN